jgi:hypothetical protein
MRSAHFLRPRLSCGNDFSARLRNLRPGEAVVGETLADDALEGEREAGGVGATALVEPEALLVQVAEQVERLDGYVGAFDGALQEAPEVLAAIGMHVPVNVALGVVDHVMGVVRVQPGVGQEGVSVESRAGLNVVADVTLNVTALEAAENLGPHGAVPVLAVTCEQAHDDGLASDGATALDVQPLALAGVHIPRFAADVGLIRFDLATELTAGLLVLQARRSRDSMNQAVF